MKIFKRIYFVVMPLLLALIIAFGFVHAFNAGTQGNVGSAKAYAKRLEKSVIAANADPNRTDTSKAVREELHKIFTESSGDFGLQRLTTETDTYVRDEEGNIVYDDDGNSTKHLAISRYYDRQSPTISYQNFSGSGYTVSDKTIELINKNQDDSLFIPVDRTVNNYMVIVPGQQTKDNAKKATTDLTADDAADAILITVHMDFAIGSAGGADLATLGTVLDTIYRLNKNEKNDPAKSEYKNDIIFLFTDARYDASYGIYTFLEQFHGLETRVDNRTSGKLILPDLVKRIKLCVNLDSIGSGDSSLILQTSKNNAQLIKNFAKSTNAMSSSFISDVYSDYPSDFNAFGDIASIDLVTYGNLKYRNTKYDKLDDVSDSAFGKKSQMLASTLQFFASADLSTLEDDSTVEYFSVLGLFTISYTALVSYILGIIVILLLIGAIALNFKKKVFNLSAVGKGIIIQLMSASAAILSMFGLYFIMGLILSGFNVFTIHSLTSLAYSNIGIMVGYVVLACAFLGMFYVIFKRLFAGVKATDVVRGAAFIWAIVGIVLAFAYPALGFMASLTAILVLTNLLLSTLFNQKFKDKFKFSIERMFFYLIPMAVMLAMVVPSFAVLAITARAILMPIMILPFIMALMMVVPYVAALKPAMDRFFEKLPKHTIRVEKVVTEKVFDKAKPDVFTEKTSKKIVNEKIHWKYRNGVAMTIIAVVACVVILISSALTVPFSGAVYKDRKEAAFGIERQTESIYDSSLLFVWSRTGVATNAAKSSLQIHDKSVYNYLKNHIDGYSWDIDAGAYTKDYTGATTFELPTFDEVGLNRVKFNPTEFQGLGKGITEITIYDASSIRSVAVLDKAGEIMQDSALKDEIYDNHGRDKITLRFPVDVRYDEFMLEFEFTSTRPDTFRIAMNQYIYDATGDAITKILHPAGMTDILDINSYISQSDNQAIKDSVGYGIVFNLEKILGI